MASTVRRMVPCTAAEIFEEKLRLYWSSKKVHLLKNSTDDAGNASEKKTAREQRFSPNDVHQQENKYVGWDLCKH